MPLLEKLINFAPISDSPWKPLVYEFDIERLVFDVDVITEFPYR